MMLYDLILVTDGHGRSMFVHRRLSRVYPENFGYGPLREIIHPKGAGPWVSPEEYHLRCEANSTSPPS